MFRRYFTVVAVVLLGIQLCRADSEPSDDSQDIAYLGDNAPIFIRLHVRVDGDSYARAGDAYIDQLFTDLDANGNGMAGGNVVADQRHAQLVATRKPNPWGLHDVHGNVWEWCMDCYENSLRGGEHPAVYSSSMLRVARGGSWRFYAQSCRWSFRSMRTVAIPGSLGRDCCTLSL